MFHINEYDQDLIADAARSIDDINNATLQRDVPGTARVHASIDKATCLVTERMIMYVYNYAMLMLSRMQTRGHYTGTANYFLSSHMYKNRGSLASGGTNKGLVLKLRCIPPRGCWRG